MSAKHTGDVSFQTVNLLIHEKLQCDELTDGQKETFLNGVQSFVKEFGAADQYDDCMHIHDEIHGLLTNECLHLFFDTNPTIESTPQKTR